MTFLMWWMASTGMAFLIGSLSTFYLLKIRSKKKYGGSSTRRGEQDVMTSAIEHRLSFGPHFVAIGGGTGLSTLLSGLKGYSRNITAVVTVTDEGGSSGRLRQEWGVLPPGDVRNCLVALAENDNSLNRILSFRFDRGELAGHSLGNLILLATTEIVGDFRTAVEELNKLLAIRGQVLPVTTESISLVGETVNGIRLRGELEISANGSRLERLWLEPRHPQPVKEVLKAIEEADLIVLGPGSLFTSILPNLLVEKVAEAVRESTAPKVYVANIMTQPGETEGMRIVDHVVWISEALGAMPDYVLVNQAPIPEEMLDRYRENGAVPLYLSDAEEAFLKERGVTVVWGDLVSLQHDTLLRHHAQRLAETLIKLVRDQSRGPHGKPNEPLMG